MRKPHLVRDQTVELFDLVVIAAEEREKARLSAGRPLDAAERQFVPPPFQFLQVEDELVEPQTGPLADGGQLGRLEVREAEGRLILPRDRKPRQCINRGS